MNQLAPLTACDEKHTDTDLLSCHPCSPEVPPRVMVPTSSRYGAIDSDNDVMKIPIELLIKKDTEKKKKKSKGKVT